MISEDEIRERIVQFENWKIKIIRWLSGNLNEHYRRIPMSEITKLYENAGIESTGFNNTEFSEALANVIAKDWKNLCKEQQEEIRKILKG